MPHIAGVPAGMAAVMPASLPAGMPAGVAAALPAGIAPGMHTGLAAALPAAGLAPRVPVGAVPAACAPCLECVGVLKSSTRIIVEALRPVPPIRGMCLMIITMTEGLHGSMMGT